MAKLANNTINLDNFRQRVLTVIYSIPYGKVTTYGEVARQAGSSKAARQVGGILKKLPEDSTLPWYRVVNRYGKLSLTGDDYQRQYHKLLAEGVIFDMDGKISLQCFGWFS